MVTKSPTTTLLNRVSHMFRKPDDEAPQSEDLPRSAARQAQEIHQLRSQLGMELHSGGPAVPQAPSESQSAAVQPWWGAGHTQAAPNLPTDPHPPLGTAPLPEDDGMDLDLDFTGMQEPIEQTPPAPAPAPAPEPQPEKPAFTPFESALRDAALLYAQGGFDAAQAKLMGLLADPSQDSDTTELLFSSLFDVYRCAGQQERFDALALDYARRFGRSPAEWFAVQDATPASSPHRPSPAAPAARPQPQSSWQCPASLDTAALDDCMAQQSAANPVCAINWSALQHIEQAAAQALAQQIARWCERPVQLQWQGLASLLELLKTRMAGGQAAIDAGWWLMQLDLLRMLEQPQAFEDLALDYCVVFEVSPPSWQAVACTLVQTDSAPHGHESASALTQPLPEGQASPNGEADKAIAYVHWELVGHVTGRSPQALQQLRSATQTANEVSVSCARMGRIDMHAAAYLVSWVKDCNARACAVQFVHLPRLVLVYFHMLGMGKLASISAGSH